MLVQDLVLPDFDFSRDTVKIKVVVRGFPLADTGRESIWHVEDWVNDKVYDGLRTDLECPNPGIITDGRPNILGSIHAIKEAKVTSCNNPTIGSYNHYHLSPNGIPSGIQR